MKLSELAYNVVKNVIYYSDDNFTYEAFITGEYDGDPDYKKNIVNCFNPINEAIHRLSDRNKIKHVIETLGKPVSNMLSLQNVTKRIKKIISIFYIDEYTGNYTRVNFREMNKAIYLVGNYPKVNFFIQFVEDIKYFKPSDIAYYPEEPSQPEGRWISDVDFDLSEIGITETMCDYIIEYGQGKLQEPIAPELANMHRTYAEQYFDDLEEQQTVFSQTVIEKVYHI